MLLFIRTYLLTGLELVSVHPKVFISHASKDKDRFVTDFARRLIGRGIDAWLDKWEMNPGDNLIDKIFEEGIGNAEALIVVLSSTSVKKPWVREEMNAGFVRRVQSQTRLIPVVIDDCDIPVALQSTYHVRIGDLSNYDGELEQIVSGIFGLSDKPEMGDAPTHSEIQVIGIPNIARIDSIVLMLACEDAIEEGDFASSPDRVWERARSMNISRQDMEDALLILDQHGFIEGHRGDDRILVFTITLYGFHEYGKAYIRDIDSLFTTVAARIVNDGMTNSADIRESLGQSKLIIEYVLDMLAHNGKITVSRPIGGELFIADVSPELKRMLQ